MNHRMLDKNHQEEVTSLFSSVFTTYEGETEGRLVGNLVSELSSNIDNQDIICFGTYEKGSLIGSIFFTRLQFSDASQVYMLAPVAVSTHHHGQGVGQALINYGLNKLKKRSVVVVITYGDIAFYSKVGFQSLSESIIQAPLKLSMPEGWLGQSFTEDAIMPINNRPTCVKAFNNPAYW